MSKKIKTLFSFLCVVLFVSTASAHPGRTDSNGGHYNRRTGEYHYHNSGRRTSPPRRTTVAPQKESERINIVAKGLYFVRVIKVIDGYTVEVAFNATQREKIRLIGVEIPKFENPKNDAAYYEKEVMEYTNTRLTDKKVWLQIGEQIRDNNQLLLGYIWSEKPNDGGDEQEIREKMFNAKLLLDGYSQVMVIDSNEKYVDIFVKFQSEARENNKELWSK